MKFTIEYVGTDNGIFQRTLAAALFNFTSFSLTQLTYEVIEIEINWGAIEEDDPATKQEMAYLLGVHMGSINPAIAKECLIHVAPTVHIRNTDKIRAPRSTVKRPNG